MAWIGNETRPGLYIQFVETAIAQIKGGIRGVVGIPLKTYAVTATSETFYTVTTEKEATDLFGSANITSVKLALQGGAKEVLVYTLPIINGTTVTEATAFADAMAAFDTRPFNVFVADGEIADATQDSLKAWVVRNRDEGKHFFVVFGGDSVTDADQTQGNARTARLEDDYTINLISGREYGDATYSSSEFAPYIAGLVAATPINKSITYTVVPADDVTKRLTNSQTITALQAGSLVLTHDGEKVKIEQGLTTSGEKIRSISARQAVSTDIAKTAKDSYIGKIDNNEAGQTALMNAIKAYLENLQASNVLTELKVELDPQRPSIGDAVFLKISYREIDSMERIFLTVNV